MITSNKIVSASIHKQNSWEAIRWAKHEKVVKKLQSRIVKAVNEKRWNKVKSLQYLISKSFSGKALAVKKVTSNKGKYTAGVDGVYWSTSGSRYKAIQSLKQRGYKPSSLRRIYIPKSNNGRRPISIPTMKDRAMQALYLYGLDPVSESLADGYSYGFRKERSTKDAIEQVIKTVAGKNRAGYILEGDIKSCFDSIDHDWLIANIPMNKTILGKWLQTGIMDKGNFTQPERGTPQGGVISPVLMNMTLDGLEQVLVNAFGKKGTKSRKTSKVHLIRYADDFIITGRTKEILELEVIPLVENFLSKRGLKLNTEKSNITAIDEGVDFLGHNIRKYKGKLILKPSKTSVKSLLKKVRDVIRSNLSSKQEELIERLNPIIRGWANYHKWTSARKTFEKVDHIIFTLIWRWAKRRHLNKGAKWIKDKYFTRSSTRDWLFNCKDTKSGRQIQLIYASDYKMQRHRKILNEANPYDREMENYFMERRRTNTLKSMEGKQKDLWRQQQGYCVKCDKHIDNPDDCKIIKASIGKKRAVKALIHKECEIVTKCK